MKTGATRDAGDVGRTSQSCSVFVPLLIPELYTPMATIGWPWVLSIQMDSPCATSDAATMTWSNADMNAIFSSYSMVGTIICVSCWTELLNVAQRSNVPEGRECGPTQRSHRAQICANTASQSQSAFELKLLVHRMCLSLAQR